MASVTESAPAVWRRSPERLFSGPSVLFAAILVFALLLRLSFLGSSDFPLNDGGMFLQAVRDVQQNGYRLPHAMSYNSAAIPFAYPPLAFYLAALLDDFTPLDILQILRIVPLIFNILTVGAVWLLARAVLPTTETALLATAFFAFSWESYGWQVMGGGLTRSPGLFFAVLAIYALYRLYVWQERRALPGAVLLASLAVLTHPESAWFVATTTALLVVLYGRRRAGIVHTALVAGGVLLLTAPWWLAVVVQHGLSPLLAAFGTRGDLSEVLWTFVTLSFVDHLLLYFVILGTIVAMVQRRWFLPLWFVDIWLMNPRTAHTFATIPAAFLAAETVLLLLLPSVQSALVAGGKHVRFSRVIIMIILLPVIYASSLVNKSLNLVLSPNERAAMAWVAANVPEEARFVVVSGKIWGGDSSSEWFPVLARRVSVATVQGHEWVGDFRVAVARYVSLQTCYVSDTRCLTEWLATIGTPVTHVYVRRQSDRGTGCCSAISIALRTDPHYHLVFENDDVAVYEKIW